MKFSGDESILIAPIVEKRQTPAILSFASTLVCEEIERAGSNYSGFLHVRQFSNEFLNSKKIHGTCLAPFNQFSGIALDLFDCHDVRIN